MKEKIDRIIETCRRLGLMVNSPPGRARLTALVYQELGVNKFVAAAIVLGMFGRDLEDVPGLYPQDRGAAETILNEYPALTHINGVSKMSPSQSAQAFHFEMNFQKLISGGPDILAEMTATVKDEEPPKQTETQPCCPKESEIHLKKKAPRRGLFAGEDRVCKCGKTFWAWRRTCIRCPECVKERKAKLAKKEKSKHAGKVPQASGDSLRGEADGSADG